MIEISSHHRELAQVMLWQLESKRLRVSLSALPDGRSIRVVDERNPAWYQAFCARYRAGRKRPRQRAKHDTLIKRQLTLNGLQDLIDGKKSTVYTQRLADEIEIIAAQLVKNKRYFEEFYHG